MSCRVLNSVWVREANYSSCLMSQIYWCGNLTLYHEVLYRKQLDLFQFLEDVSLLIEETSVQLTGGFCRVLNSVWVFQGQSEAKGTKRLLLDWGPQVTQMNELINNSRQDKQRNHIYQFKNFLGEDSKTPLPPFKPTFIQIR